MRLSPHLNFNGRCAEAFRFYASVFGGTLGAMTTHGETPARNQVSPDWHDKIMHAELTIGDTVLMGVDLSAQFYQRPQGFSVAIQATDAAEADRVFAALAQGGSVRMPIQKTFWAERFGMLTDRFGIPWMINCAAAA
jgi:PhnB protein